MKILQDVVVSQGIMEALAYSKCKILGFKAPGHKDSKVHIPLTYSSKQPERQSKIFSLEKHEQHTAEIFPGGEEESTAAQSQLTLIWEHRSLWGARVEGSHPTYCREFNSVLCPTHQVSEADPQL